MNDFDAGSFSDLAHTPIGRELWDFLNEHDNIIRLQAATFLKRPALEVLQPYLLTRFGDAVREDRVKQMIGRMTRQVMERHGYVLDQSGVRCRVGNVFLSASRYRELNGYG